MLEQGYAPFWVWLIATAGNSLGSVVNWILGRFLTRFESRRWFPFKPGLLQRSQAWFQKYGIWSLLFAWLPVGGDALTFIAGVMKVRVEVFFILTAIGKGARYALLYFLYSGFLQVI
ncbi:MAG: DedA family protein [Gammaproteobacteria bacterium]|nr:DedA family protein [Gammaproteobacteria bacterium]